MGTYLSELDYYIISYTLKNSECPTLEHLRKEFAPFKRYPIPADYFVALFVKQDSNAPIKVCPDLWTLWYRLLHSIKIYEYLMMLENIAAEIYTKYIKEGTYMSDPLEPQLKSAWISLLKNRDFRNRVEIFKLTETRDPLCDECDRFVYSLTGATARTYENAILEFDVVPFRFIDPLTGERAVILAGGSIMTFVRAYAECELSRNEEFIVCENFSFSLISDIPDVYNDDAITKVGVEIRTSSSNNIALNSVSFPTPFIPMSIELNEELLLPKSYKGIYFYAGDTTLFGDPIPTVTYFHRI